MFFCLAISLLFLFNSVLLGGEVRTPLCDMCHMLKRQSEIAGEEQNLPFLKRRFFLFSIVMCDTDRCDRCDMLNRQSELAGKMRVASFPANSFSLISKRSFNMSHVSHMSQRELRPSPPIFFLSFQKGHLTCHTCLTCHKESCVLPLQYFFSHFKKVI